ncbi:MAG: DHH family phosphoesterase [Candidatus Peribacteria bacterium]|nr:MAG: DHH family phosphoesterase [Candidatus Peribacteria bacterium]
MDPDAFGSLAGFYRILKNIGGYTLKATNDELPPESFGFLNSSHIIEPDLDIKKFQPDLIISFDASSIDQLGNQYRQYEKTFANTEFVVIDHHISNPGFGKLNLINTDASSTCEIVWHIIETLGLEQYVDRQIATLLTTGLLTDTNIYYNANTTGDTLRTGAKLLDNDADFRLPMFEFYKKKEFYKSKLWGEVLRNLEREQYMTSPQPSPSKREGDTYIYWSIITSEMFAATETSDVDVSGLINEFLANLEGMEVCFLLYPLPDGKIKASLRSNSFDVSELCQSF